MSDAMSGYRIGVDIGGTFTDVVLWNIANARTEKTKLLTTPDEPSRAVMEGVRQILSDNNVAPREVDAVIHGTTLVANALIERKGVKTGLITTRGFKDVLEIGREWRYDLFNLDIELPTPIVDRPDRHEITERVDSDGNILTPIELSELDQISESLAAAGIESVGVCLLHAYRNASHESAIRDYLAKTAPTLSVSLSSDVSPEMGEYERSSTTVANAYIHPIFKTYVDLLVDGLSALGCEKDLLLVLSDGRTVRQDTATQFPIRLVQSGPAAGAQAASIYGAMSNEGNGTAPAAEDATWVHRMFNSVLWQTPGGDFSPLISALVSVGDSSRYTWDSTGEMVADVQGWIDDPSTNFGWLILGNETTSRTTKRFDSKESPTAGNRPTLTIIYEFPAEN